MSVTVSPISIRIANTASFISCLTKYRIDKKVWFGFKKIVTINLEKKMYQSYKNDNYSLMIVLKYVYLFIAPTIKVGARGAHCKYYIVFK